MTNQINISELQRNREKLLEKLKLPDKMVSGLKNVSDEQKEVIKDVLGLMQLDVNDRDFGSKTLMSLNVALLSTIAQDLIKNFNFMAKGYSKNDPAYARLIDSICKVMSTQNKILKDIKSISIMGAPQLHIHQHAKGKPSFKDGTVVIMEDVNEK